MVVFVVRVVILCILIVTVEFAACIVAFILIVVVGLVVFVVTCVLAVTVAFKTSVVIGVITVSVNAVIPQQEQALL